MSMSKDLSDYVSLNKERRVLMAKRRLSAESPFLDPVRGLLRPDILKNNILGYLDTIGYVDSFSLAYVAGHRIPKISEFIRFVQALQSGVAYNGNGNKINSEECSQLLEDAVAASPPTDLSKGESFSRGERFSDSFSYKDGVIFLVSHKPSIFGPEIESIEPLEQCLLLSDKIHKIDLNSCNNQGLPTKPGKTDWCYWPPDITHKIRDDGISGIMVNAKGEKILAFGCCGVPGTYPGMGVRFVLYL